MAGFRAGCGGEKAGSIFPTFRVSASKANLTSSRSCANSPSNGSRENDFAEKRTTAPIGERIDVIRTSEPFADLAKAQAQPDAVQKKRGAALARQGHFRYRGGLANASALSATNTTPA